MGVLSGELCGTARCPGPDTQESEISCWQHSGIALPISCAREWRRLMTSFLVFNDFLLEVCFILDLSCNLLACVLVIWIVLPVHSNVHCILCLLG